MQRIIQTVSAEAAAHLQIRRSIVAALGVSLLTNAALALTLLTKTDNSRTVVFLLVGLGTGLIRGSVIAAVTALGAAVALLMLPTIVDSLFNGAGI